MNGVIFLSGKFRIRRLLRSSAALVCGLVLTAGSAAAAVTVEALEFVNNAGRSAVVVKMSAPAEASAPIKDGRMVRFTIADAVLGDNLKRSLDASQFPSAVKAVTPYLVAVDGRQSVRIAVELKGDAPYTMIDEGKTVKLVVEDGSFASAQAPALPSQPEGAGRPAVSSPPAVAAVATVAPKPVEQKTAKKISLVFDSIDVRNVLQLIGDVSGMNIIASDDVKGEMSIRLLDVPWDQALDLVLTTKNLDKIQQGNVYRVLPVEKIRELQLADARFKKEQFEDIPTETRFYTINYSKVEDVKTYIKDVLSKRGTSTADPRNKQLIISDVPAKHAEIGELIRMVDQPERQVMIEARIVEANTNFSRELGVSWFLQSTDKLENEDWKNISAGLGGSFLIPVTNPGAGGSPNSGGTAAISFGAFNGNFDVDLRLSALEEAGDGKIISTPRISTLNGQKATISQGTEIPYTTKDDNGQTEVTWKEASLALEVTPEINPDGSVMMDIFASNDVPDYDNPVIIDGGAQYPISKKQARSKVLVKNGQTTVIGGIFIENESESNSGVPFLKDIPYLGHLFKSTSKNRSRRELLIFITPRIIES